MISLWVTWFSLIALLLCPRHLGAVSFSQVSLHFSRTVLPYELYDVWLSFTFILVELRNKWIVTFWIVLCPFSAQKCQCAAVIPTSVLRKKCGLWHVRQFFRDLTSFYWTICGSYWSVYSEVISFAKGMFTVNLEQFDGHVMQDKLNSVHGSSVAYSGCVSHDCFLKIFCSFVSMAMITIHIVHSFHFHWFAAIITAFPCIPHIYTWAFQTPAQVYVWHRLWFAKRSWVIEMF